MKLIRISLVALLMPVVFFSCKKDNEIGSTNNKTIAGKWVGTYGFGSETPHVYFSFDIKSNGVIDELNSSGASKGSGSWNLAGTTFTAQYQWKAPMNTIYSVSATYNASTGKLTGTWGYGDNATNGGLWEQTKQ